MTNADNHFYFFHAETKTIFYSKEWPRNDKDYDYLGRSDNRNHKMAAGIFMKQWRDYRGCKIREYTGD